MAGERQNNLKKKFLFKCSTYSGSSYAISFQTQLQTWFIQNYSPISVNDSIQDWDLCSIQIHQSVLMIQFDWLIHKTNTSVLLFANLQFLISNYGSYWVYGFNNNISFSLYLNIAELVVCSFQTDSLTHSKEPYRLTGADCV